MSSYRQIFRFSAITGIASVFTVVIGIVKIKLIAILIGASGTGLMGVYQNIIGIASTVAGCGIGSSGVRQLAVAVDQVSTLAVVRRALWIANFFLGLNGMAIVWLLREPVAIWVFGNTEHSSEIGWLSIGVFLTLITGSQTALLQGMRRIGDLARVSMLGALLSTFASMWPVYFLRDKGVHWCVLISLAVSVIITSYYAARLPKIKLMPYDWPALGRQWQAMLQLGFPLMIGNMFTLATQLVVRSIILREIGLTASGYFEAAWYMSMTYIGFILGAMALDYYPRLTAVINDHSQAKRMVKEQSEMALLLSGPILLSMITFAPWFVRLLYAVDFTPAADVLRWQVLGDILKVSSWPMSFILLAQGRGGVFIGTEFIWNVVYLSIIILGIQVKGLAITGIGFWIAYSFYYSAVAYAASRSIGYLPAYRNWLSTLFLMVVGGGIIFFAAQAPRISYIFGSIAIMTVGCYSINRLNSLMQLSGLACPRNIFNRILK